MGYLYIGSSLVLLAGNSNSKAARDQAIKHFYRKQFSRFEEKILTDLNSVQSGQEYSYWNYNYKISIRQLQFRVSFEK